jgi:hypothetical protein
MPSRGNRKVPKSEVMVDSPAGEGYSGRCDGATGRPEPGSVRPTTSRPGPGAPQPELFARWLHGRLGRPAWPGLRDLERLAYEYAGMNQHDVERELAYGPPARDIP